MHDFEIAGYLTCWLLLGLDNANNLSGVAVEEALTLSHTSSIKEQVADKKSQLDQLKPDLGDCIEKCNEPRAAKLDSKQT